MTCNDIVFFCITGTQFDFLFPGLSTGGAVQTKPLRLWPWCLVGDEDGSERSALQAMWGSRVQPQRALRPGMILMGAGELEWGREAELRHGESNLYGRTGGLSR